MSLGRLQKTTCVFCIYKCKLRLEIKGTQGFGTPHAAIQITSFSEMSQQENARTHSACVTIVWLHMKKISGICPDVSPTENVQCFMKHKMQQRPQTAEHLIYQARMTKNFVFNTSTICLLSVQRVTECC